MKLRVSLAAIALAVTFVAGCNNSVEPVVAEPSKIVETAKAIPVDPLMKGRVSTIIGVNYVGMTVADVDRSKAYYTNAIDLKPLKTDLVKRQTPLPDSIAPASNLRDAAILQGPNSYLRLLEYEAHQEGIMPVQGTGVTHICFIAPKDAPIDGKFVDQGATWQTTSQAMVDMRGVGYMYGYQRDLDGLMMEIEHAPEANFDVDYWMGHVALATPDMTQTLAFYTKVLGFDPYRRVDDLGGPTFSDVAGAENAKLHGGWFRLAPFYNLEIWEFVNPKPQERASPAEMNQIGYSIIMFETTDIEADYNRIQSAGVKVESEIVPVVEGRAFYLRDLDGNLIGLTEFDKDSSLSLLALK